MHQRGFYPWRLETLVVNNNDNNIKNNLTYGQQ